ncbi:dihydrolipoyl dehydrogenase [Candidatus Woesearchaeota archaeon]|nr:dihydrolipoyl dehydrogenase [Candidatus Woesearchaeota archaeon]
MNKIEYDAVIIGAGPGGYTCAIRISQLGGKACIVEKDELGGTCTNWGCIPTKSLIASIQLLKSVKRASRFGIDIKEYNADFQKVMQRKNTIVKTAVLGIKNLLDSYNVNVIQGEAHVLSKNEVKVNEATIKAKNIVIATGSNPIIFPNVKVDGHTVLTSRELLSIDHVPKELIIIGGGIIGIEFATIFSELGTRVTIIEMLPRIIATEDEEIGAELSKSLEKQNVTILTNHKFLEINDNRVKVLNQENKQEFEVSAEKILFAVGRRANFNTEELDKTGVKYEKAIIVDSHLRTNIPNVYAIGDVNGKYILAHVAMKQGEVAGENIMGQDKEMNYDAVPSAIFTIPEIASVGKQYKEGCLTGKFPFAANGKARADSAIEGFCKVIVKDNKLLGVHIIGENASSLIEEAALAIKNNIGVEQVLNTIHAHPTLCEILKGAVEDALNRAIDLPKKGG